MSDDFKPMDQEGWQRFKAMVAESYIQPRRALYDRTGNPIHALHAYRLARTFKIAVPGWTLELFDQWAKVLCQERPKEPKEIVNALGLETKGGGPSITVRAQTEFRDLRIAQRVFFLRDHDPERATLDVFHQVAEQFALSSDRVASIWYKLTRAPKP